MPAVKFRAGREPGSRDGQTHGRLSKTLPLLADDYSADTLLSISCSQICGYTETSICERLAISRNGDGFDYTLEEQGVLTCVRPGFLTDCQSNVYIAR